MKNGKINPNEDVSFADAFGGGELELEQEIKTELAKKNLGYKWVNAEQMKRNNGRHKRGWKVYQREASKGGAFGETVDGTIRRGDLVLGVKPLTGEGSVELHKAALRTAIRKQDGTAAAEAQKYADNLRGAKFSEQD